MIFSRLSRSLPRSSRSGNLFNVGGRLAKKNVDEAFVRLSGVDSYLGRIDGGLGFLRSYFASIGVNSKFVSKSSLSDVKYILANPKLRRLFSTEPPKKKNYENCHPKGKKEIPKGEEQKTESKDDSKTDDQEAFVEQFLTLITPLLLIAWFLYSLPFGAGEQHQISFQEFKNKLLEPGLVDHIVISNKSVAKVFVRSSPLNQTNDVVVQGPVSATPARGHGGQYKYYFNVGGIEHFEEKLEEAQGALNIDPHDYVPVINVSEKVWYRDLMRFAPTLSMLGTSFYMFRRMQGGLGVGGGGGGGRGGRGIFNIGKAHIMRFAQTLWMLVFSFFSVYTFHTMQGDSFKKPKSGRLDWNVLRPPKNLSKTS